MRCLSLRQTCCWICTIRRADNGLLEFKVGGAGLLFDGWLLLAEGQLFAILFDTVGQTPIFVIWNGVPLSKEEFGRRQHEWLPTTADSEYLLSIMAEPVYEPGKFANYIAPPQRGIKGQPVNFEYVRTEI